MITARSRASTAAPTAPARSPSSAGTIAIGGRYCEPSTWRRNASCSGPKSSVPSSTSPPAITIRSGSRMFASPARPSATLSAYCASSASASPSPCAAAVPTAIPVDRVAVAARGGDDPRSPAVRDELTRHPAQRRARRDRLPVAALAARAHRPVDVDGEVAELGGEVVRAAVHAAVQEHAAADAGAERHEQRVPHAACRAVRGLAERRDVRVVVDDDRVPGCVRRARRATAPGARAGRFGEYST